MKMTDEDLLSYLLGDCEESHSLIIKNKLKTDPVLRERLSAISFIQSEVKKSPLVYKVEKKREPRFGFLSKQLILGCLFFIGGLLVQSNFEVITKKNMDVYYSAQNSSEPLSWDKSDSLSVM